MDIKWYICTIVIASVVTSALASCRAYTENSQCTYTIVCLIHAGSAANPNCENGTPNVTFVVKNSILDSLMTRYFASTNFDSRVRTIIGIDNDWNTIDSSAFRYFTSCLNIDLSHNGIINIAPGAFKSLIRLQTLNLSRNSIEKFDVDSFKITESRNTVLEILDLSHNYLVELSTELNELSGLKELYLQNNRLSIIADDAFIQLKSLSVLDFGNNLLDSLNSTLTPLKMLTYLDVFYNNLTKLAGYEINRLVSLVNINVSHNSLTSIESNCFNQAFSLQSIDFSYNYLNITIENVMFINNNQLGYIDFNTNNITSIEDNSFKHNNLYYFNVENNCISGEIKENTFTGLNKVKELDLSRQNFTAIRHNAFSGLRSIIFLNVSKNRIDHIENSSFVDSLITVLDLSFNNITNLAFLQQCLYKLTELYLNNNNIDIIPTDVFNDKNDIKLLDLSMNKLKSIEPNSLPLKNLQYFNINGNQLQGVIKSNVFSPAKYLRFLNLNHFHITKIDDSAFINLPVLARLSLSNNQIETIHPNNFKGVDNMYSLDVSYNNLKDFQFDSSVFKNVQALYINNNKLNNVSQLFSNSSKLLYLDMSSNEIENGFLIGSDVLPQLTSLYLSNNNVSSFNNPKTNSLSTLMDLHLSSNRINIIDLSFFKLLTSVDLSKNNITFVNYTLFQSNELLQALDLSQNNINDLPPGTFRSMNNLKFLNISGNNLVRLRYGSLNGLHKTEKLDLSKNYITSLDVDVFHECEQLQILIIDYNQIKTFEVDKLIKTKQYIKTISLGGNPIACKEIVSNVNRMGILTKSIEVTSIDKIYHEDNVHGIKCGDYNNSLLEQTSLNSNQINNSNVKSVETSKHSSSSSIALIWCSILTILLVVSGILLYFKLLRKKIFVVNVPLRNSRSSIDPSEFQTDLLN